MGKLIFLKIITLLSFITSPSNCFSKKSILNKLWVGKNNEYIKADSTVIRFETFSKKFGNTRVSKLYSIRGDTLKIVETNNDESGLTSNFLLNFIGEDQMTLTPINSGANQLTNLITLDGIKATLSYKEIHQFPFDSLKFEKIIFNSTECFGRCPVMTFEINSEEKYRFIGGKYSARKGYYYGSIGNGLYNQLLEKLRFAQLDLVECNSNQNIDLSTFTLEVYYNKRIRYFKSCMLPFVLDELKDFLLALPNRVNLIESHEKFEIGYTTPMK